MTRHPATPDDDPFGFTKSQRQATWLVIGVVLAVILLACLCGCATPAAAECPAGICRPLTPLPQPMVVTVKRVCGPLDTFVFDEKETGGERKTAMAMTVWHEWEITGGNIESVKAADAALTKHFGKWELVRP